MSLTAYDTAILTSIHGVGRQEAKHFVTCINNVLAGNASGRTYLFDRALNQLVGQLVIGSGEAKLVRDTLDAYDAGTPDTGVRGLIENFFYNRLRYLAPRSVAVALADAFAVDLTP